jgi:hypothetical protein
MHEAVGSAVAHTERLGSYPRFCPAADGGASTIDLQLTA